MYNACACVRIRSRIDLRAFPRGISTSPARSSGCTAFATRVYCDPYAGGGHTLVFFPRSFPSRASGKLQSPFFARAFFSFFFFFVFSFFLPPFHYTHISLAARPVKSSSSALFVFRVRVRAINSGISSSLFFSLFLSQ